MTAVKGALSHDVALSHDEARPDPVGVGEVAAPVAVRARDPRAPFPAVGQRFARRRDVRRIDVPLAAAALTLALIGAVLVYAATRDTQRAAGASGQGYLYRHVINVVIGAALMLAASRVDARVLRLLGVPAYLAGLCGLGLVLVAGTVVNGARAWIEIGGGLEIQPAEFTKLGLIVGLAVFFSQRALARRDDSPPPARDVLVALVLTGIPMGLVLLQPDLGSALVVGCAAFGVLVAAGVRARWTLGLLVTGGLGAVAVVRVGVLDSYQLQRVLTFAHPGRDLQGAAYNVTQARLAIAHGGLFGTGLFAGPRTNGGVVPEQQTDFIFSAAGEEFGFVGCVLIVALLGVVCWRALRIARDADEAGRLIAVGVVCWFGFQAFENIGMNLGLTPVTGVPLPFVSYGGSSMFAQALALGLLQAVHRRNVTG